MTESAAELEVRLKALLARVVERCDCPEQLLQVRLRTVAGGSKHHVLQCTGCGEQRGNALGAKSAQTKLAGATAQPFDGLIAEAYIERRRRIFAEHSVMERQWLLLVAPDAGVESTARNEADNARDKRVLEIVERCAGEVVAEVGEEQGADALAKQAVFMRQRHLDARVAATARFSSEKELKQWLVEHLAEDFFLYPEVTGRHAAEGVRVQIDYLAFPKPHLVAAGFVPAHFGVEVKYLNQQEGFSHKASRGIWQTVSYTDSVFDLAGQSVRLKFALLFSNLSFADERSLLEHLGQKYENDHVTWHALLQLANHANVGNLEIKGSRDAWKGWKMAFSGGTYFSRSMRDGERLYRESNRNMIDKVRVGNF